MDIYRPRMNIPSFTSAFHHDPKWGWVSAEMTLCYWAIVYIATPAMTSFLRRVQTGYLERFISHASFRALLFVAHGRHGYSWSIYFSSRFIVKSFLMSNYH